MVLSSLVLQLHNPNLTPPPHQQLLAGVGSQLPNANGCAQSQNADNQHPNLLVNTPNVSGSGSAAVGASAGAGVALSGVWVLQEHTQELREGACIEKIQLGTRKWCRAAGSVEGRFDLNREEDVLAMVTMATVMNGKRTKQRTIPFVTCDLKRQSKPAKLT